MRVQRVRELLALVTKTLSTPKFKANLLNDLAWPREVEERFFASGGEHVPEVSYPIDRNGLNEHNDHLERAVAAIEGDEPIPVWLRAVLQSHIDKNRMLLAIGTPEFTRRSQALYGSATTSFFGGSVRNIDLAEHLLKRLQIHGWDEAQDPKEEPLSAVGLAQRFQQRLERRRPRLRVNLVLDDRCTAKIVAGMNTVRIRPDATFVRWEAEGLWCHEVETHVFTALNGAAQAEARFLRFGGPRTTLTQEGLAIFAELYNRSLGTARLERLAVRVKLVHMAERGASFLDLYRYLIDLGRCPRDAYLDAARICRGGICEGGAPFTKDTCYLAGLLHVYTFFSTFVRGGFRDEAELLVSGRLALDDVAPLVELRAMGVLKRPKHRPQWLRSWGTLLPYFAFSSFMDAIDLGPIESHYKHLIDLAAAARPRGEGEVDG